MNGKPQRYALVGMKHRGMEDFVRNLPADEPLVLVREPDNKFDPNAVQVWARGHHIGYVPKTQNMVLARFIDANGTEITDRQKADRWSPIVHIAADGAISINKAIDARLHLGSNTYPLVEVV